MQIKQFSITDRLSLAVITALRRCFLNKRKNAYRSFSIVFQETCSHYASWLRSVNIKSMFFFHQIASKTYTDAFKCTKIAPLLPIPCGAATHSHRRCYPSPLSCNTFPSSSLPVLIAAAIHPRCHCYPFSLPPLPIPIVTTTHPRHAAVVMGETAAHP